LDTSATLQTAADTLVEDNPELEAEALGAASDLPADASEFDRGVAVGIVLATRSERIAESVDLQTDT
jgi:hypothetical protein